MKLNTRFEPDTRFKLNPIPAAPFRVTQENALEHLKKQLLERRLEDTWETFHNSGLRRAANEAAALAWVTPYPLLVFPLLFEEKADEAVLRSKRQAEIRQRSRTLMAA